MQIRVLASSGYSDAPIMNGAAQTLVLPAPPADTEWVLIDFRLAGQTTDADGGATVWSSVATFYKDGNSFKSWYGDNTSELGEVDDSANYRLAKFDHAFGQSGWYLVYNPTHRTLSWEQYGTASDLTGVAPRLNSLIAIGFSA